MMLNVIKDSSMSSSSQIFLRWNGIAHSPTNGIRIKVIGLSHESVIVREGLLMGKPQFDSLQPL